MRSARLHVPISKYLSYRVWILGYRRLGCQFKTSIFALSGIKNTWYVHYVMRLKFSRQSEGRRDEVLMRYMWWGLKLHIIAEDICLWDFAEHVLLGKYTRGRIWCYVLRMKQIIQRRYRIKLFVKVNKFVTGRLPML